MLSAGLLAVSAHAASPRWQDWARGQSIDVPPVVQNQLVQKAGRFQLVGPVGALADRRDFLDTWSIAAGVRYHFSELHAWEILRVTMAFDTESTVARQIREQTSYKPDSLGSRWQLGGAYVFSPIYGKYAWMSDSVVRFDAYLSLGAGVRLARELTQETGETEPTLKTRVQPFGDLALGMNHTVWRNRLSIVPEARARFFREQRTTAVLVREIILGAGVAWLF